MQHTTETINILSDMPLSDWRGSLTTFKGFTGTLPEKELSNAEWSKINELIRPESPAYIYDKKQGEYFVPCALKDAPLVGNTLAMAKANKTATVGKMRSKSHVTEASMLIMDIDGLAEEDFLAGLDKMKKDGVTYLAFTSFSYGNPAKPGTRARLVIPLDRPVSIDTYSSVWKGFDSVYWDGQAGVADSTGANMYQQQGTWCCDSSRQGTALSWTHSGGVASVDALITAAPAQPTPQPDRAGSSGSGNNADSEYPDSDANKVADACQQIGMFRDHQGAGQSEPLWFDCLGVVGHCEGGSDFSQKWSSGHADYNEAATDKKITYRMKTPPTTCSQFRKTNPDGCVGCAQHCNSPITLGRKETDAFEVINTTTIESSVLTKEALEAEIRNLSGLAQIDYDLVRKDVAKKYGIQVKTLDDSVKGACKPAAEQSTEMFPSVVPSPDPVEPAKLFGEISTVIKTYIAMSDEQTDAATLWIALTWVIDAVKVAPLAIINAPEKACGKTQLLEIMGFLSAKPLSAANISTAGLFRITEKYAPTILIDEADTFMKENYELKGLINAGHTRTSAFVIRVVGESHEPKKFNVFGAKALAGISLEKHLPDATMSRGVVFAMRRKLPHETVKRLRHAEDGLFEGLQTKLARFAVDYSEQVRLARPALPEALSDRAQDNWDPLLAIASCAGAEWLDRATQAALALSAVSESAVSLSNELLMDIRFIFETKSIDKISSSDLIESLCDDEERPWATFNRGKMITHRQLAMHLTKYGINSKTVRSGKSTPKGYDLGQFEEVFSRYLSTETKRRNISPEAMPDVTSSVAVNTEADF